MKRVRKKPQDYPSHSRRLLGKHLDEKLLQGPESEKEKKYLYPYNNMKPFQRGSKYNTFSNIIR